MPPSDDLVRVSLIDAETGEVFARTELAAGQLPQSFAPATRLDLDGDKWDVVLAEPSTAAEYTASGSLELIVRRIRFVDPLEIKYTLPTFYDPLPPTDPAAGAHRDDLVIHEDDWRQVELVSADVLVEAGAELAAIAEIRRHHSRLVEDGARSMRVFERIRVRQGPVSPLPGGLPLRRLLALLPPAGTSYKGVRCRDARERLAGSFAVGFGTLALYGRADGDRASELCLTRTSQPGLPPAAAGELADGLVRVLRAFDLRLVDWCQARLLDASGVPGWLYTS